MAGIVYIGPRTNPCGTPHKTAEASEIDMPQGNDWMRPLRYDVNHSSIHCHLYRMTSSRVVRQLVTGRSSSPLRASGTVCHPVSLRQRHSAFSSAGWRHISLLLHSTNWTALHQFLFCIVNCKVFLKFFFYLTKHSFNNNNNSQTNYRPLRNKSRRREKYTRKDCELPQFNSLYLLRFFIIHYFWHPNLCRRKSSHRDPRKRSRSVKITPSGRQHHHHVRIGRRINICKSLVIPACVGYSLLNLIKNINLSLLMLNSHTLEKVGQQ